MANSVIFDTVPISYMYPMDGHYCVFDPTIFTDTKNVIAKQINLIYPYSRVIFKQP